MTDQAEHSQINRDYKVHKKNNAFPYPGTIILHPAMALGAFQETMELFILLADLFNEYKVYLFNICFLST